MTNPTTPFSWQMPTASDLVTDLPADFETFGQAVATSMADLLGGTTGQILSKASNTDMDFTWITNDVGDITAVTAGTGLSGGGTSGAVTLSIDSTVTTLTGTQTLTNKTLTSPVLTTPSISNIDAKGDLLAGTADNTIGRLAIGSNGQVLTADSAEATGMKWATAAGGGMTKLSTTTLSGASTSITVATNTYASLFIKVFNVNCSNNNVMRMQINSDTTAGNYATYWVGSVGYATTSGYSVSGEYITLGFPTTNGTKAGNTDNIWTIAVNSPNGGNRKVVSVNGAFYNDSNFDANLYSTAGWESSATITSIQILTTAGTFSGGTVEIYGV